MRIPENRVCEILSAVSKIPLGEISTYGQNRAEFFGAADAA